jgi:tRNA1(Val) A37 N6-methylase TrmN6
MAELTHERAVKLKGLLARTKEERGKARKERDAAEARVAELEEAVRYAIKFLRPEGFSSVVARLERALKGKDAK